MRRIALLIEYDGTRFAGWQFQPDMRTVQGVIEKALLKASNCQIRISGAGRTDAGVHASGQVACFTPEENFTIPIDKIPIAINSKIPHDVRIITAVEVDESFHSRFTAIAREYKYNFSNVYSVFNRFYSSTITYKMDIAKLFESPKIFIGEHDFTAFSKHNPLIRSFVCNVEKCYWEQVSENSLRMTIKADRFVYGMVRSIVGAMIDAARSRRTIEELSKQLAERDKSIVSPLAPPEGLTLSRIYYKQDIFGEDTGR